MKEERIWLWRGWPSSVMTMEHVIDGLVHATSPFFLHTNPHTPISVNSYLRYLLFFTPISNYPKQTSVDFHFQHLLSWFTCMSVSLIYLSPVFFSLNYYFIIINWVFFLIKPWFKRINQYIFSMSFIPLFILI